MQKLITIVIPARNDKYYHNFSSIINFTINYSLLKIYELNLENIFEILLIDWQGTKSLNDDIYIPLNFRKNFKIIRAPKKIIKKNLNNGFNVSEAQNFGLNYTKSRYCFLAHADQIYSKSFFLNMETYVNNKHLSRNKTENSILYIPRKFLDENFFSHNLSEKTVDEYFENLSFVNQKWKNDQFFIGGGQSGWFGTKKVLQRFGGLKEDLILKNKKEIISADLEFYQRYSQYFNFYDSSNFGIFSYRYPYIFSKNRNDNLLKRLPPIEIDKPIKKKYKKKQFIIEKLNNRILKKNHKLSKNNFYKNKFTNIKKYIYYTKNEIIDDLNEDQKANFIIREFLIDEIYYNKIISYIEYGYIGSSIISVIGNFFKGIDILAADFSYKYFNQKVHNRLFKISNYFHKSKNISRFGKTKLISFDSIDQSTYIFSYLPKEKLKTIMTINPFKMNSKILNSFINKNSQIFYCLIINSKNNKLKILKKYFNKYHLYKNTYIYLNKLIPIQKGNKNTDYKYSYYKKLSFKYYLYKIFKLFF